MILKPIVAAVALTLACIRPGEIGAMTVSPGQSIRQELGSMTIDAAIGREYARVTVTIRLRGELVAERVLTPTAAEYRFAVAKGPDSARGVLRLALEDAPRISSLDAELACTGMPGGIPGGIPGRFAGSLATWIAPEGQIWYDTTMALSPGLFARTVVTGTSHSDVSVTLLAGSVTMYTISVNQTSPTAVIAHSLVLGDVWVGAGARFTMTIPTTGQRGQMFMNALFESRNIPRTLFSAAIATWP